MLADEVQTFVFKKEVLHYLKLQFEDRELTVLLETAVAKILVKDFLKPS